MVQRMAPWLALAAAACGNASVRGEIDGEGVGGARDAFYDTLEFKLGPFEYEAKVVVLTDFPDGCEVFDEFYETAFESHSCEEYCSEYEDIMDDHGLPFREYWSTTLYANVTDDAEGEFDYDADADESGTFNATFTAWDTTPLADSDTCVEICEDGKLLEGEGENAESGDLELEDDGDELRGDFELEFGGDDVLDGGFAAHPCDMGDWF